jgi:hypothetical protein
METTERRLTDYRGFKVYKITDNKGIKNEVVTYMLNDNDDNNMNCYKTLKELKFDVDKIWSK